MVLLYKVKSQKSYDLKTIISFSTRLFMPIQHHILLHLLEMFVFFSRIQFLPYRNNFSECFCLIYIL